MKRLFCILAFGMAAQFGPAPFAWGESPEQQSAVPLDFEIKLETIVKYDGGDFLWFHPRAAPMPGFGRDGGPAALITLQKHLSASDFYSGLFSIRSDDLGKTWTGPNAIAELAWIEHPEGIVESVADVTPGWHAPTGKLIAVGARVRYGPHGEQLTDVHRAHQTAYAVYDPREDRWSKWQIIEMPSDKKFDFARSACSQWIVEDDGSLLLPMYFNSDSSLLTSVTVVKCSFDGKEVKYQSHGTEFAPRGEPRCGLHEPSLARWGGKYYLTIRNEERGYVTVGDDGLNFAALQAWQFDDGAELGSYNTQQHWLTHSDGLLLTYTRHGANNDHIMRHRAPLFVAQVDPATLRVVRDTEKVLIPERGATMGNFGAASIDEHQSWVTVSEGVWDDDARRRGAEGATYVARVLWNKPNRLMMQGTKSAGER